MAEAEMGDLLSFSTIWQSSVTLSHIVYFMEQATHLCVQEKSEFMGLVT